MQVYHDFNSQASGIREQLIQLGYFAVYPLGIFGLVTIGAGFAPGANQLPANQVCSPFCQVFQITPAVLGRRHYAA